MSDVFSIHCHHCHTNHLVGARSVISFHRTLEGPIAYLRCPEGHVVLFDFNRGSVTGPQVTPDPIEVAGPDLAPVLAGAQAA